MISMSQALDKEKIWVPDRIRTYALPDTGRLLYPLLKELLELENSWRITGYLYGPEINDQMKI